MKSRLVEINDGTTKRYSVQRRFLGMWWPPQIIYHTSYESALEEFEYYQNYKKEKTILKESK